MRSSIKSISLPSGLTSIGDYAFYGCSALSAVTVPNSVTSIGDSSFDNCTALATVKLGSGVRSIDKWAFYRCGWLTSITLPKALVSIGKYAFYSSTQLKNVYYAGSSTNRAAISIDYCNEYLLNATWHYNYTASKPKITTQPKAVSVKEGAKATFKVVASGATSYQWQYQKPGESSWTNVSSGGTSTSYTLTTAAKHNGYKYRCRVKNGAGTVYSSAVKLTVKSKPKITTQPKAVTVITGAKATFKVSATGATSYQWQYRAKDSSKWVNMKTKGTSAKYTLTTASRHNGYTYRVKITNSVGTVYSNAVKLTVKTPTAKPKITTQPKSTTVEMGKKATFKVVASNATSYQWQYQKKGESSWSNVKNGGTSASLTVTTESRHDGYKYRCKVTNAVGSVYSSAAKLTVKAPAKYRALLIGVEHSLSWKKNYSEIPDKYRGSYVYVSDWTAPYFYVDVTKRNSSDASRMANMLRGVYGGKSSGAKYQINLRIDPSYSEIKNQIKTTFADTTENDVSLFFIATHGVSDGDGDLVMPFTSSLTSSNINSHLRYEDRLLPFSTLASWLGQYVKGDVIVIIQSCGAGSSIFYSTTEQNGVRTLKAAADEAEAFVSRAIDTFAGLDGTTTKSTGDLRKSRYYVLAAARHHELSYGWENQSDKYNWFTKWLTDGVGKTGSMPADKKGNSNGVVDLVELFNYINQYRTESASSYNQNQHVQYYPVGNKYPLFK